MEELDCSWRGIFFIESGPLSTPHFRAAQADWHPRPVIMTMASSASMGSYTMEMLEDQRTSWLLLTYYTVPIIGQSIVREWFDFTFRIRTTRRSIYIARNYLGIKDLKSWSSLEPKRRSNVHSMSGLP